MGRPRIPRMIRSFETLPALGDRWTPSRKEAVVRAIASGQISIEDAMRTYRLSIEEVTAWTERLRTGGRKDLRASAHHLGVIRAAEAGVRV